MMKPTLLVFCLATINALAAAVQISDTRCEYRKNPIGIETKQPRFHWVMESKNRGVLESAYQVIVASSPQLLERGNGDVWDSGKVASDDSTQVAYGGKALASGTEYFWKVRVWDNADHVSDWSKPATWTMGLLNPSDWKARWIGFSTADQVGAENSMEQMLSLEGLYWIWANGAGVGDQPPGDAFFRKTIEIPDGESIAEAKIILTADDSFELFINGESVAPKDSDWKSLAKLDVKNRLRAGQNILAIKASNVGNTPAGVAGRLGILFASGKAMSIAIDNSWQTSRGEATGWNTTGFDASEWKPASKVANYGDQPWGTLGEYSLKPAPYFRKTFTIAKPIHRATAFASALGAYELHLNGKPVDNDVLSPGWTDFNKRVHYFGYDVTSQLKRGNNVLGAILGDGWYVGYIAFTGKRHFYGGDPRLIVQVQIDYEDGTREVIGTDETWKATFGPIREDDLQMGCVYDARKELKDWDNTRGDDSQWRPAQVDSKAKANLMAHPGEPIRRELEIPAIQVTEPKPGVYVFDLGQNMVGWARLQARGDSGQQIVLRHAEMLNPDGTVYTTNLRAARATDTFVLADNSKRALEPYFTFHGFRYVEVTGLKYKPSARDMTGVVVYSDLDRTGWFECSEPLVNKLVRNSLWGQEGNFLDVPTDCPQRNERAGWTGDAQVFMKTACLNMNAPAFYTKWLQDLCDDSQQPNGGFCDVAPLLDIHQGGNTGWSDAGVMCNWRLFEMYGDTRAPRQHYSELAHYMDYLANTSTDFTRDTGAFGDWLRLTGPQKSRAIGTAYYFYTTRTMKNLCDALGEKEGSEKYGELMEKIRGKFAANYIKPDGQIRDENNETGQTLYALAFGLGLVPEEMKSKTAGQFVAVLKADNDHIATGFLGTPFVLFALQKAGHPELAYKLVLNKTYPSWLQQVLWGSTTMWERWDGWRPDKGFQDPGMNSFNHYWLGCVSEWLFTQAAGIDTDGPAFKHIIIRPEIVKAEDGFDWVNASYRSIRGTVASKWKLEGDKFRLNVTVPANATAVVYVPAKDAADVTEGGRALERASGVKFLRMEGGRAVIEIGSGEYAFASRNGA